MQWKVKKNKEKKKTTTTNKQQQQKKKKKKKKKQQQQKKYVFSGNEITERQTVFSGTPVNRIPIMAKQTLDLYELFKHVVSKGGLVEVINKKLWREITKGLNLPSSITSAAFTLRTQYVLFLMFMCFLFW